MAVKGVFASDQNIQANRKGDFASVLLQTMPTGSASLLALSAGMQSRGARDTVVTWFEENHLSGQNTVTNNAGTGTTWTMGDASQVYPSLIFWVPSTGEYVLVESVSGNDATVKRGYGGTTITSIDGSGTPVDVQRIGNAHQEGSPKPVAMANIGFPRFNYQQIFRNAWDVTGTARAVEYHTGDIVAKNKRDAALFHAEDMERSIMWGVLEIGVLDGQPYRTMDGVQKQLITNQRVQSTNTTWDDIDDFLRRIFEWNVKGKPNERIAFCGNTVIAVLNKIARLESTKFLEPGETEFGFKINRWMTPYGDVSLMTHPLMNESPVWTKDLIVLHPGAVETRWLRRTSEDRNDRDGTRAGADADFGVITSEMCVTYASERTGGYYTGIDTAAAS